MTHSRGQVPRPPDPPQVAMQAAWNKDVDPQRLAEAKVRLRETPTDSPDVTYCAIPAQAFDREDLLLLLSLLMDQIKAERDEQHAATRFLARMVTSRGGQ